MTSGGGWWGMRRMVEDEEGDLDPFLRPPVEPPRTCLARFR
jgi:hypothetical protein